MKITAVIAAVLCAGFLLLGSGCNKAELAKLRTDLNTVTNEKNSCDLKLAEAEKAKGEIQKQKADLEAQLQAVSAERDQLKAEKAKAAETGPAAPAAGAKDDGKKKKKGK